MTYEELEQLYLKVREAETMILIWRRQLQEELSKLPKGKEDELEKLFLARISQINGLQPAKIRARWKGIEQSTRNLSDPEDKVLILIEDKESSDPRLLVSFSKRQYYVDIIQSIKDKPSNISHPLILWAIIEYSRACNSPCLKIPSSEIAKKVIGKICKTLTKGEKSVLDGPISYLKKYNGPWPPEYFVNAAKIHTEIKMVRNSSEKRHRIREALKEFPNLDHTKMIKFLESWGETRKITPNVLRNAFFAYVNKCELQTVKNHISMAYKALRQLDPNETINEENMQRLIDSGASDLEFEHRLFGIGVINSEDEITKSALVWEEREISIPDKSQSSSIEIFD